MAAFAHISNRNPMGPVYRMEGLVCGFCDSFRDIGSAVFCSCDRKINRLEREEYLFYLVQAGIAGLIPMILVWTGIVQFAVPSVICAGISFLTLAALFIFCKKDTMREFHKKLRM